VQAHRAEILAEVLPSVDILFCNEAEALALTDGMQPQVQIVKCTILNYLLSFSLFTNT
jgi:sugar/nucleoside kinase (ribokinase family)